MIDRKKLVLVDGSSYLFRAFHAMPPLENSKGKPTGAVYGVANMLKRLLKEHTPDYIAVVFDAKGKTFRDDMFPEYKANRPPAPEELVAQIKPLHELVKALGLPLLCEPGVEADDIIGTLAVQGAADGLDVTIASNDKDFAQLVTEQIKLRDTMRDVTLDHDGVIAKFGVPPEQIIDYLALMGDTVDNVPGVDKVGPKTAAKWLQQHGSLDAIMADADNFKGKVGEHLRNALGHLPLSKDLVTIRTNCEIPEHAQDLTQAQPDSASLKKLYSELEFKTWLSELLESGESAAEPQTEEKVAGNYETILEQKDFDIWLNKLQNANLFAFDTETTSLNAIAAEIVGVSFAVEAGSAAYVPLIHSYIDAPKQLDREQILAALKPLLEDPNKPKLLQNAKYDMNVLANHGIKLQGVQQDTMLESYIVDSNGRHDMDTLALKYLGHNTIHFVDIAGKGKKQLRFDEIALEEAGPYAAEDADVTLRLHHKLQPLLAEHKGPASVYKGIEVPLISVLASIERNGVKIDANMLAKQSMELADSMAVIEQRAHELGGGPFNMNSPKQIQEILYEQQGLPVLAKTPKGAPSTAEAVLEQLAADYELPRLILENRSLAKLKSTYTDKLPGQINPDTGRIHTSYHQAVAATGRLSSSDPNLQNIPIRSAEGRRIRQAFVPEDGYRMVASDYSQIELRIMAHLSGDEGLLNAFSHGADVHRQTAAEVFEVSMDEITTDQRRSAKAINFGLIYGMSAFGLAKQLGIERGEASEYIDRYFARYPGVKDYMDRTRAQAHDDGYVETVFGRRLWLPEINSRNGQRRQYAERTAINAPMQGTAADIIKRAMINVHAWIEADQPPLRMIMQVHDELVFEIAKDSIDDCIAQIEQRMSAAAELAVPLLVETGIGDNWDEAH